MSADLVDIIAEVQRVKGVEAAYAVSVAFQAADTLRLEQPDKFRQAWGSMGFEAIEELMFFPWAEVAK